MTADTHKITEDMRWTRENGEWVQVPCFRFTRPDGRVSWADMLDDEQLEMMKRQQQEADTP